MSSEETHYQTRIPPEMATKVEAYRDQHDLTKSEAIRQLVDSGIEQQDRGEKWVQFGQFLHVTAFAAAFLLAFSSGILAILSVTSYALGIAPDLLAVMALAGVFVGLFSDKITAVARRIDEAAIKLGRKIGGE